jgi:proline racemase
MYGGFITPSGDSGAHFGVLFWHKDGFSTACGHGTIALGYWAIANKVIAIPDGAKTVDVVVDVPSGKVVAKMNMANGKPTHSDFINVPSYQFSKSLSIEVLSRDIAVEVDLAFSGAVYATLDTAQLGLDVEPQNVQQFIQLGREIKASLGHKAHYGKYDCYGVIFFNEEPRGKDDGSDVIRQRNVTI